MTPQERLEWCRRSAQYCDREMRRCGVVSESAVPPEWFSEKLPDAQRRRILHIEVPANGMRNVAARLKLLQALFGGAFRTFDERPINKFAYGPWRSGNMVFAVLGPE